MSLTAVMVVVILVAGIASAFLVLTMNEHSVAGKSRNKMKALYCAEAGAEHAANLIRVGISTNPDTVANLEGTITIGTWPESVVVTYLTKFRADLPETVDSAGLYTDRQSYEILAECKVKGEVGRVFRVVEAQMTPIFQFLAFYDEDLEANPGPAAYWNGRLHTNKDLYLTNRDGNAMAENGHGLIIDSEHVQAVGKVHRKYKQNVETNAHGRVRVRQKGTTPPANPGVNYDGDAGLVDFGLNLSSDSPNWTSESTSLFGGSMKDGSTGAQTMVPPDLASINPNGFFHKTAESGGLVVENGKVYKGGQDITNDLKAIDAVSTSTTIYDAREQANVPVVTLDVGKIMNSSFRPTNGLIYATESSSSASSPKGFQLVNGSTIPGKDASGASFEGLTIVSNAPVYVKGDFNGHTYTSADLASGKITDPSLVGKQDPAHPKQPCAIIADAVNLLSNNWNNTKGPGTPSAPSASPTTFNFAMIGGNGETQFQAGISGQGYNGGLQNLPRFHENWSGVNCNIKGSFVNLWRSVIADGQYLNSGKIFSPPKRLWDFDVEFNDPSRLPPWTPKVTKIGRTTYEEGWTRPVDYDLENDLKDYKKNNPVVDPNAK